ncbi:YeiH family protein [Rathayibacter iranicus]|uniref:Sulfate exporter family transporter n=2 Tax=Rathayibacter iranicus TaxID=59737 RepID=A0AAD1AE23_9MICO|nr:putative sulfate exporter family transporter [Rathayibacter iranicus]AZZ54506.1 putative sulfate exporter family transporter [Rathayibacter iranicus]MWV29934.1 putative sulfate exporter family transporter [Rathayibacter iranicus NCPPB 2253 = VKM Ac-1602]PPI51680.1 putative sulfate exporter family transporter [Rathayibacter iranicus]PPI63849.1 putative sulfate exporter family transporter [Rathayibacter iranicus]PPI74694.1 putative sulfate exporter family transporter [Rathayibacter iranicus]
MAAVVGLIRQLSPGVAACTLAAVVAAVVHAVVPAVPMLTAAVALGILVAQVPSARPLLGGELAPGLRFSSRSLMRAGIVLLGLKLSLVDSAALGWGAILVVVGIVLATFALTWALGQALRLPGREPLLLAAGFAICGASAIGAMAGATRTREQEQATPVALVTLCGTLAIAVLPALQGPFGLSDVQFGHWVGASVHDVGQVVATAQVAGGSALAVAVLVKLTRVVMLAPMVAVAAAVTRRRGESGGSRPAIVPLFVVGFLSAVLLRTLLPLPAELIAVADTAQTWLLAAALVALGSAVRVRALLTTGWRALVVALVSWASIAAMGLAAVQLAL